jgi:hypothetical protein
MSCRSFGGLYSWRVRNSANVKTTAGHISLFRESDRLLIAGDAVSTTKQESFMAIASQRAELHGPPAYMTTDWDRARESVEQLAALRPATIAAGHGQALAGPTCLIFWRRWRGTSIASHARLTAATSINPPRELRSKQTRIHDRVHVILSVRPRTPQSFRLNAALPLRRGGLKTDGASMASVRQRQFFS